MLFIKEEPQNIKYSLILTLNLKIQPILDLTMNWENESQSLTKDSFRINKFILILMKIQYYYGNN